MSLGLACMPRDATRLASCLDGASSMPAFGCGEAPGARLGATLSAAVSVDPAVASSAGAGNSSMLIACAGRPSSAGALAGFGATSHKYAVPKKPAVVAAATAPSDTRESSDRRSPSGAEVIVTPLRHRRERRRAELVDVTLPLISTPTARPANRTITQVGKDQVTIFCQNVRITEEHILTLHRTDQTRADFALNEGNLEFIAGQLARLPTRRDLAKARSA